jgi:filamentous hemagglutinin family protein
MKRRLIRFAVAARLAGLIGPLTLSTTCFAGPVVTHIVADSAAGRSVGTTVTSSGSLSIIDGGTLKGGNLFESFSDFSLAAGDTARWTYSSGNPSGIGNVINRVTGGSLSDISGTIDTTDLPNASFYFINPAGIVFGNGARVDVPNAAHFSTAQALRFSDGAVFSASTPSGSTLSTATPAAFGFLGGQGDIAVDDADSSFAGADSTLSLSAADISIADSDFQAGRIDMAAVGNQAITLAIENFLGPDSNLSGDLSIGNSDISTTSSANASGAINIAGGDVSVTNSTVQSNASDTAAGGDVSIKAQNVTIQNNASVSTTTDTDQNGGNVAVEATGLVAVTNNESLNGANLGSASYHTGDAGNVTVTAASLLVDRYASIGSDAHGSGNGGQVTANILGNLALKGDGSIETSTMGDGNAGDLNVSGGGLSMEGFSFISSVSLHIGAGNRVASKSGKIKINILGKATLDSDAEVSNLGFGPVAANNISFDAKALLIDGGANISSAGYYGEAGKVSVHVPGNLTIKNGGHISSGGEVANDVSGEIGVHAGTIRLQSGGSINTDSNVPDTAGDVTIHASKISIDGARSKISSANVGRPLFKGEEGFAAGDVTVAGSSVTLSNGGSITTNSKWGPAGDISLNVPRKGLLILEGAKTPGAITTSSGKDSGGHISISDPASIVMNGAKIEALGPDNAADITIDAGAVIKSTDRSNDIAVNGSLALDSQIVDVSKSLTASNADFVDTSAILKGRCAEREASGRTSEFGTSTAGPYAGTADALLLAIASVSFANATETSSALACAGPNEIQK